MYAVYALLFSPYFILHFVFFFTAIPAKNVIHRTYNKVKPTKRFMTLLQFLH